LGAGFIHLHEALDGRSADVTLPELPVSAQRHSVRVGAAAEAQSPSTDSAALDQFRGELATLHQQVALLSQNYAEANADYQQAADKVAALTQQNSQLQLQLAEANARSIALQEAREQAEHRAKTSEQALTSKNGNSAQLAKNLEAARNELEQSELRRTTLQNRVQALQIDLQAAQVRADQANAHIPQIASDPSHAPASPGGAEVPTAVHPTAPELAPPEHKPATASPHAQNGAKSSELERLLASTGLDIDRLLRGLGGSASAGEGGPYIALNDPRAGALGRQRLEELQRLAKDLPLASPLGQYQLGSGYGARVDPINHRESFHPGLDLDAPYRSTVYSTGVGVVIFTGNMDSYGKVVEIDHGHGIITRYAHLHRILVAKGQKVGLHTPIAELGSTGRSTGPHLHYEVRVDGQTVDPAKFMQAGKNVVQVSGQP
jgi:murein DD-endopeptidase MepM/ murein hydrolase activator NlpD